MKGYLWGGLLVVFVLFVLVFGGWYWFVKKSPEGGSCANKQKCEQGLQCVKNICSSGKIGSICTDKTNCLSGFCVNGICTDKE